MTDPGRDSKLAHAYHRMLAWVKEFVEEAVGEFGTKV